MPPGIPSCPPTSLRPPFSWSRSMVRCTAGRRPSSEHWLTVSAAAGPCGSTNVTPCSPARARPATLSSPAIGNGSPGSPAWAGVMRWARPELPLRDPAAADLGGLVRFSTADGISKGFHCRNVQYRVGAAVPDLCAPANTCRSSPSVVSCRHRPPAKRTGHPLPSLSRQNQMKADEGEGRVRIPGTNRSRFDPLNW